MRQLLFFELKKLWVPRVIVSIVGCLFVVLYANSAKMSSVLFVVPPDRAQEYFALRQEQAGPIDEAKAGQIKEKWLKNSWDFYGFDPTTYGDPVAWMMEREYLMASERLMNFNEHKQLLAEQVERISNPLDYDERVIAMEEKMISQLSPPGFYEADLFDELYGLTFSRSCVIFMVLIFVFALSPIFSGEAASGMDAIILSSAKGRFSDIWAKIIAASVFAIGFITVYTVVSIGAYAVSLGGFKGLNDPINAIYSFAICPFPLSQWQGMLWQYGMMILGSLGVCACIVFVSALLKNTISSLAFTLLFLEVPLFITDYGRESIAAFFPSRLMVSMDYFSHFRVINIFGSPVLFPIIGGILICVITIACCAFMKKAYLRRLAG